MGDVRDSDEVNRSVMEYVRQMRDRLAAGRSEIDRQRGSVDATQEHIDGVRRWIDETDRLREPS